MMKRWAGLAAAVMFCAATTIGALADDATETQIGQQEWQTLQKQGVILPSSPLYGILNPIAARIKRVADPQYYHPFNFYLVHMKQPNAFAVPGGNVYVTDSLMTFVRSREELAGVLCHETSHDIHHDVVNNMRKDQNLAIGATILGALFGGRGGGFADTAINTAASLQALSYSRPVETAADLKGSDTCAAAGYNPWGLVWLMQDFEKASAGGSMEALSDHPTDSHRIDDLQRHFQANPAVFAHFNSNQALGTPVRAGETSARTPLAVSYR